MRKAYCKIENGKVTAQELWEEGQTPEGETWLPIIVENPAYSRATHYEVRRENIVKKDHVLRVRIIEPIPVTPEMIKEECQKRIIALTGGGDLLGSLAKQINSGGKFQAEIDRLRAISNAIEKMNPVPIDFLSDSYWS